MNLSPHGFKDKVARKQNLAHRIQQTILKNVFQVFFSDLLYLGPKVVKISQHSVKFNQP